MTESMERAIYVLRLITEFENKLDTFWPDAEMMLNEPELSIKLNDALNALNAYRMQAYASLHGVLDND